MGNPYEYLNSEDMIEISKEDYGEMQERLIWLDALEAAGLDNWEGVDLARDIMEESENDE